MLTAGGEARHMRGLAEKIWKVFAPSSCALRAVFSSVPWLVVWIPILRDPYFAGAAGPSELIMSSTAFHAPSDCFLKTVRYLPLSVEAFLVLGLDTVMV